MADTGDRAPLAGDGKTRARVLVLAVVDHWSSARGGVGTFNRQLCKALAAADADVYCVVEEGEPRDLDEAQPAGVRLSFEGRRHGLLEGKRLLLPPDIMFGLHPDVILGHGRVTGQYALALRDQYFPRASCLHFVHTDSDELEWHRDPEEDPRGELAERKWAAEADLMRRADYVLAVGPRLYRRAELTLRSVNGEPAVEQIDPGFDVSGPPPEPPRAGQLLQVIVAGRLGDAPIKGLDIVARAVAEAIRLLGEDGERVRLLLCGAESGEKHNSRELRVSVLDWSRSQNMLVSVRTFTSDAQKLQDDLRRSALLLMPSRAEGFGLVGLEAIAAGIPVLINARSGLAELVRSVAPEIARAIVLPVEDIPASDETEWGHATAAVLRDPDAAFSRAADLREQMCAKRSWAMAAHCVLNAVSVLRRRAPGAPGRRNHVTAFVCRTGHEGLEFEGSLSRAVRKQIDHVNLFTCVKPGMEHVTTAEAMADVLLQADVVLFVLTEESSRDTGANPCLPLLALAREQGKRIVVLRVGFGRRPPIELPDSTTIEFTGEFAGALAELAGHLAEFSKVPHKSDAPVREVSAVGETGSEHEFVAINDMPDIVSAEFQDREPQRRVLKELLSRSGFRLIQLEGENGIGKTALLRTVRVELMNSASPALLNADVYFSARGFRWITVPTLLEDLVRTGDPEGTPALVGAIRTTPWRELLDAVVRVLARRRIVVVIDDADELFDTRDEWKDRELRELLTGLATRDDHEVKVVMSVKRARRGGPDDALLMRHREEPVSLNRGLSADFAKPLLAGLDIDNRLAGTPDAQLALLLGRTAGHPRALELVAGILHKHRGETAGTLSALLEHTPEPAGRLFEFLFLKLDLHERRVAQALAVFSRPVTADAVTYLLKDVAPDLQTELVLRSLRACFLIHSYGDRYYLPSADAAFVLRSLLTTEEAGTANALTQETMWLRGAAYFQSQRATSPGRIEELWPQFGEMELSHRARRWPQALRMMNDIDDRYLTRWGQSHVLVSWRKDLRTKLVEPELEGLNLSRLVAAGRQYEGHTEDTIDVMAAFGHAEAADDPINAVAVRIQLANALSDWGHLAEAERHYREAVTQAQAYALPEAEIHGREGRARCLVRSGDFAAAQEELGKAFRAAARYDQGSERAVVWAHLLVTRAWVARQRGDHWLGQRLLEAARELAVDLGTDLLLGRILGGLAANALVTTQAQRAIELTVEAARIGVRLDNHRLLRDSAVTRSLALLETDDLPAAAEAANIAARYARSPRALNARCAQGLVAYRQQDYVKARNCFDNAMDLLPPWEEKRGEGDRDYHLLDAKGAVLCGLALLGRRPIGEAIDSFARARRITSEPGVLAYNDLILRQFGEQADSEILARAQHAACGNGYGGYAEFRRLRP